MDAAVLEGTSEEATSVVLTLSGSFDGRPK